MRLWAENPKLACYGALKIDRPEPALLYHECDPSAAL